METRRGKKADPDTAFSVYLSFLLRHQPDSIGLDMDEHGWVNIEQLILMVNVKSKYHINASYLDYIVNMDFKGRYKLNDDHTKIRACQGHTIPWVKPDVTEKIPPDRLYHGTTTEAYEKIQKSGKISKMARHAVHMHDQFAQAAASARRWRSKIAVVLVIDAKAMADKQIKFYVSDNNVWLTDEVPVEFISSVIQV